MCVVRALFTGVQSAFAFAEPSLNKNFAFKQEHARLIHWSVWSDLTKPDFEESTSTQRTDWHPSSQGENYITELCTECYSFITYNRKIGSSSSV